MSTSVFYMMVFFEGKVVPFFHPSYFTGLSSLNNHETWTYTIFQTPHGKFMASYTDPALGLINTYIEENMWVISFCVFWYKLDAAVLFYIGAFINLCHFMLVNFHVFRKALFGEFMAFHPPSFVRLIGKSGVLSRAWNNVLPPSPL